VQGGWAILRLREVDRSCRRFLKVGPQGSLGGGRVHGVWFHGSSGTGVWRGTGWKGGRGGGFHGSSGTSILGGAGWKRGREGTGFVVMLGGITKVVSVGRVGGRGVGDLACRGGKVHWACRHLPLLSESAIASGRRGP